MPIWVDADACPKVIKEILFRVAERARIMVTLLANQPVAVPRLRYVRAVQVAQGFDVADNEIVLRCAPEVLDAKILAIAKGATALNPRGELYTKENVKARLNMRDFMDTMRSSGIHTGGPPALNQRDRQAFANALDRFIAQRVGPHLCGQLSG